MTIHVRVSNNLTHRISLLSWRNETGVSTIAILHNKRHSHFLAFLLLQSTTTWSLQCLWQEIPQSLHRTPCFTMPFICSNTQNDITNYPCSFCSTSSGIIPSSAITNVASCPGTQPTLTMPLQCSQTAVPRKVCSSNRWVNLSLRRELADRKYCNISS